MMMTYQLKSIEGGIVQSKLIVKSMDRSRITVIGTYDKAFYDIKKQIRIM
jgi:hypothetical protein